ncbi:MAG: DUF4838 domain-containing protein [Armatimonadota bacterium]
MRQVSPSAIGNQASKPVQVEAVIIIPEAANQVVRRAAHDLQYYAEKATGVKIPIVSEDAIPPDIRRRIYLGPTQAALKAGINPSKLPRDSYQIKSSGDVSYLAGHDRDGDPDSLGTPAGTLFAVYDVLDRDMGVRWLWPGVSGEYIPKRASLMIKERNVTVLPRFRFAGLRTDRPQERMWMRRMHMHDGDNVSYGHSFERWGEMYFKEHPEWFELTKEGKRIPGKSMCVSNPGLHKQIVENWWAANKNNPSGDRPIINICENDGEGLCQCPDCRAWDGPEMPWPRPEPYQAYHNVGRRYARFEMAVLKLARQYDPKAQVVGYAYSNMVFAPSGVKMDKDVLIGYCCDVFMPRKAKDHAWVLQQYMGWANAGASVFLRPNYLLNGYCMPCNWSRQFSDEFQFFVRHGLMGTDFDSLTGMWSTMGLTLYVLGRLHVDPRKPLYEICREYYSAFGPAATQVKAYLEYWESYNQSHLGALADGIFHYYWYPEKVFDRYPPECFRPAEKLIAEAERAASSDTDAAAKVAFLKAGMVHAKLCVEASLAMSKAGDDESKKRAAVERLVAYRKTIADPMVVNVERCRDTELKLNWPV